MTVINPSTEDVIGDFAEQSADEVDRRVRRARQAFEQWQWTSADRRAALFKAVAALLRQRRTTLAETMAREMGKPIGAGESEADKCATACDYFADHAPELLEPHVVPSDASRSYVRHDPLGVVLAIMPWNFPFWQFFRFAALALMAGNTAVLKHAPNVPGCAEMIERLFADAGFPDGVVVNLRVGNDRAEALIRHEAIAAVTLTGSTRAGKAVAGAAASVLKKSVLELGGSDPFIVLPDADVAAVARQAAGARCINSGQSCIAAKRFIVVGDTEPFSRELAGVMKALKVGDPDDRATEVGPLARLDLLENLHDQVRRSVAAGAKLITGGRRVPRKGYFYEPTALAGVKPGMAAFDEETFGPVAAVIAARDIDDAIRLANQSRYGLGASIWSADGEAAAKLAARIEAGNVFINGMVRSDPRLPFGGIKESGWGRELGAQGLLEFTNAKTVWIK
jgi:acyl-CoA reductase-like NAD-dependent aldehyde dehydrogenase